MNIVVLLIYDNCIIDVCVFLFMYTSDRKIRVSVHKNVDRLVISCTALCGHHLTSTDTDGSLLL